MPPKVQVMCLYCYKCGGEIDANTDKLPCFSRYTTVECAGCGYIKYNRDAIAEIVAAYAEIDIDLSEMLDD